MRLKFLLSKLTWKWRIIINLSLGIAYVFLAWFSIGIFATRTDLPSIIQWFWIQQICVLIAGFEFGSAFVEWTEEEIHKALEEVPT